MLSFLSCSSSKRLYPANHLSSGAPDSREGAKVHRLNVETGTLTCGSSPDSGPAHCPAHHISQPRPTHSAVPPISPTTPPTAPPLHPPHRAGLTLHPRPAHRIPPPRPSHPIAPPTTPRRFAPTHLLLARVPPGPASGSHQSHASYPSSARTLAFCWLTSHLIPPMTPSLPGSGHLEGGSLCAGGSEAELRCCWRCLRLFRVSAPLPRVGGGNLEPWLSGSCVAWQGLKADLRDACPRTPCCRCRVS